MIMTVDRSWLSRLQRAVTIITVLWCVFSSADGNSTATAEVSYETSESERPWSAWIGLSDQLREEERSWIWGSGRPMNYHNWYTNEPNNMGGTEYCVNVWPSDLSRWNDYACNATFQGVCKKGYCGNRWTSTRRTCYQLTESLTRSAAQDQCRSMGGSLAMVKNSYEQDELADFLRSQGANASYVWIGLTDPQKNRVWKWDSGSGLTYDKWIANEPNNAGQNEYCVNVWQQYNFDWNDVDCNYNFSGVCKQNKGPPTNLSVVSNGDGRQRNIYNLSTDVLFRCQAKNPSGHAGLRYEWSRVGASLPATAVASGGSLRIPSVRFVDAGVYYCTATNQYGNVRGSVELIARGLPEVPGNVTMTPESIVPGEDVRLECRLPLGAQRIEWRRPNGKPLPSRSQLSRPTGETVTLRAVTTDDAGVYLCFGINTIGTGPWANISVSIPGLPQAPIVQLSPAGGHYEVGQTVQLTCNVPNDYGVSYTWRKNHDVVTSMLGQNVGGSLVFRLTNVQFSNAGSYTCTASNSFGETSTSVLISVVSCDASSELCRSLSQRGLCTNELFKSYMDSQCRHSCGRCS